MSALPDAGRLLGVDLGDVRVGLARCDGLQTVATPVGTLDVAEVVGHRLSHDGRGAERGTSDEDLAVLADAVGARAEEEGAVGVVVGYPRTLQGREGAAAERARRLAELIAERAGLPTALEDERLSSVQAERAMRSQGASRSERREAKDRVAAALILQSFLDRRRSG